MACRVIAIGSKCVDWSTSIQLEALVMLTRCVYGRGGGGGGGGGEEKQLKEMKLKKRLLCPLDIEYHQKI